MNQGKDLKTEKNIGAQLIVSGEVQDVGFRGRTKRAADNLRLLGYVRNRPDNQVEVEVEGEKTKIEELIKWMKERSFTTVTEVKSFWRPCQNKFTEFTIKE